MMGRLLHSHLFNLVVFSGLVSTVFGTLLRDDARSRIRFGLVAFAAFVLSTFTVGWLMRALPS